MSFAPTSAKEDGNPKPAKIAKLDSGEEYFPEVPKIEYKGPESTDPLSYRFYNPDEEIMGKKMKDWLRFSVCFWHTFRGKGADPFGFPTMKRHYDDESDSLENAKSRANAAFEMFTKLGVEYYTFHDRDVAPEGKTLEESNANLDEMVEHLQGLQEKTGVKLLWATQNLFSHPRYMNGGFTNPDVSVLAYAASQVKKVMDINFKLGGENIVFWGGREGYQTILNTDMKREIDHMAAVFKMAIAYKEKHGMTAQFLIEPKPREPCKHQYDYDAQTTIAFLKTYGLDKDFKLNIEPNHTTLAGHDFEHDIMISAQYGMLGSVDSNTGDPLLGWDTDQFPMDHKKATLAMGAIVDMGGLSPGGLNFDCKVRRESTEDSDLFIGHIGAMDTFARGLRIAAKIRDDGTLAGMVKERYATFDDGFGKKVEEGTVTLEDCEEYVQSNGEPEQKSGKQELFELVLNRFV
uniref:Xylose isomerase n=1 Tax=Chaetoceros debilis TaxID=122233 RepID=A0A7S3QJ66_9STRA|mmetsp:Transcript_8229/g.12311  ORF Transcript_8229/g.12311 Transcript_8229/m.12311 type:complete len:461 (+) Transcript_8229:142-1524(+)|eukprot:CAMPEP_0194115448 /NCGR_PEP_ID=MMETSP0150-20130528/23671_1 /TAXON_ID=122233 /ORGANISM="Chaetoceros debilis, Strain MM31A-1" /LENGTH=460 /DNA_ID=CAMNT_0038805945 /DNA_START=34 /DNA_END=1416 /DNA_ORIENTATION=-